MKNSLKNMPVSNVNDLLIKLTTRFKFYKGSDHHWNLERHFITLKYSRYNYK